MLWEWGLLNKVLTSYTDQLEKELKKQQQQQQRLAQQDGQLSTSEELIQQHGAPLSELADNLDSCKPSRPVDVGSFIVEFTQKNYGKPFYVPGFCMPDTNTNIYSRLLRTDIIRCSASISQSEDVIHDLLLLRVIIHDLWHTW